MGPLCELFWVARVWVTAAAVLVAGLPHYQCRCPDGRLKPFCLGVPSPTTGCCCGGACRPASPREGCCHQPSRPAPADPARTAGCCCQARPEHGAQTSGPRCRVEGPGCRKTLAQAEPVTVTAARTAAKDGPAPASPLHAPSPSPRPSAPTAGHDPFSWQSHRLPPPTDLVITLRHLVI